MDVESLSRKFFKDMAGDKAHDEDWLRRPASVQFVLKRLAGMAAAECDVLKEILDRLKALEEGGVKYFGTYQRASAYTRGSVVTEGGSMWIALRDTKEGEQPGKVADAWQLAEKTQRRHVPGK